ncbi:antitoxin VbhA family protein [Rhodococcus qingshengii]|uniref:antitoxin VbhA family protein n=1 Tax=Rhodococcus qingshengii TaxID=334542 RepID=UPI001A5104DC|nr:antitoxin VbhA family protein [Rhodococcus qingshengii]
MVPEHEPVRRLSEAEIDRAIAAATAGHRMAGMEPTEHCIEVGRLQLRGEISGDEAVAIVLAENRRRREARSVDRPGREA